MAKINVDEMSDEEVTAFLEQNRARRECVPSEQHKAGGAPRSYAVLVLVLSALGIFASARLLLAERTLLSAPNDALACDFNPLVGCSDFLTSQYNTLIADIPNALWGVMFFSGMAALGLAWLSGACMARWLWQAVCVGMIGASAYLVWFWYASFFVKGSMCPYCILTWVVTIPLIVHTWVRSAQAGHIPCSPRLRIILVRGRWLITAGVYLAVVILALVTLWNKFALIL